MSFSNMLEILQEKNINYEFEQGKIYAIKGKSGSIART